MQSLSLSAAAQTLLARVANNVGDGFGSMLDMLAQELAKSVRIYGLDSRTQTYRAITADDMRGGYFANGAAILKTAGNGVFTLMTVHRDDFEAYLARLRELDMGSWKADQASTV